MKHFYNLSSAANTLRPTANVLGTTISSKIISLLFVCFFLLVSGESVGQVGTTFTANGIGDWRAIPWTKTGTTNAYPQAGATVIIPANMSVTVSNIESCGDLRITNMSGNNGWTGGSLTIANNGILNINSLTIDNPEGRKNQPKLDLNGNGVLNILGNLNLNSNSDLNCNSGIIRVGGTFQNLGTFNKGTGTVEYNGTGTAQAIANLALGYHNLILSGSGTKTVSAALAVSGNLTVNSGATFDAGNFTHTVSGNLTVQSTGASIIGNSTMNGLGLTVGGNLTNSGTITLQSRILTVGGNFTNNTGGVFTAGSGTHTLSGNFANAGTFNSGGTVAMNGGGNQTISFTGSGAFNNLTLSGTGAKTATSNLPVSGNLTVSSGSTFNAGNFTHTVSGNFTNAGISNASTSTVRIGGAFTNTGTFNEGTGTVEYNGTAQAVANVGYHNLILSGTGTKTTSTNLSVSGDLTTVNGAIFNAPNAANLVHSVTGNFVNGGAVNSGSGIGVNRFNVSGNLVNAGTFNAVSGINTITGNFTNTGTFNAGTGTIVMNGVAGQTISFTGSGVFNNLTLSGGDKSLLSDITVDGSLALSSVILSTGINKVVLGNAASISGGESATQNITGTVETTRLVTSGATQTFGNIGFAITNSNADFGQVTVTRTTGSPRVERNEKSANRQYTVSSTTGIGVTGTSVTMRFPEHDLNEPKEETYDLYKFVGSDIARLATSVPHGSITIMTTSDLIGLYTIYSSQIIPLPVELVSFKAQRQAKGVNLTWATASELDNKGFEVQVSTDSKTFQSIGFTESKVGTTSIRQDYSFLDTKGVSGTRYYRLKQIDFDGKFEYSAIRAVSLDKDNGVAAAYPNPFNDVVTVKLTGTEARQVKAVLTDAMGKLVLETTEETAGNTISVNTGHVTTKGLYVLHVLDNGTRHTFKLMKR